MWLISNGTYTYTHIHTHTRTCDWFPTVHTHIHTYTHTHTHTYTHTHMHKYTHTHIHTYTRTCNWFLTVHTHIHTYTHTHIHTYTHTHIHTYTHTHIHTHMKLISNNSTHHMTRSCACAWHDALICRRIDMHDACITCVMAIGKHVHRHGHNKLHTRHLHNRHQELRLFYTCLFLCVGLQPFFLITLYGWKNRWRKFRAGKSVCMRALMPCRMMWARFLCITSSIPRQSNMQSICSCISKWRTSPLPPPLPNILFCPNIHASLNVCSSNH